MSRKLYVVKIETEALVLATSERQALSYSLDIAHDVYLPDDATCEEFTGELPSGWTKDCLVYGGFNTSAEEAIQIHKGCNSQDHISRVCELGTLGCNVRH